MCLLPVRVVKYFYSLKNHFYFFIGMNPFLFSKKVEFWYSIKISFYHSYVRFNSTLFCLCMYWPPWLKSPGVVPLNIRGKFLFFQSRLRIGKERRNELRDSKFSISANFSEKARGKKLVKRTVLLLLRSAAQCRQRYMWRVSISKSQKKIANWKIRYLSIWLQL